MNSGVSIIYANRNRDAQRIRHSLTSLQNQTKVDFEVVFVDYGSAPQLVEEYRKLFEEFPFVRFFPLQVSQLLWNKSKALNYGIKAAKKDFVFIADVDLIFHPEAVALFHSIADETKFQLFPLNYLSQTTSQKLESAYKFEDLKSERKGLVNGMILASLAAMHQVWGLDEFFHFYGSEDEDLFGRLENAGYLRDFCDKDYFLHYWHPSFSGSEDTFLTTNPRMRNIMRINQRHFQRNREEKGIRPSRQNSWGEIISVEESNQLAFPSKSYKISNVLAQVEHFLMEELPANQGEIVEAIFYENIYYGTLKYRLKKFLGKQTQAFCSMKDINDMVLKSILYQYRDRNYSFKILEDKKEIHFTISLRNGEE